MIYLLVYIISSFCVFYLYQIADYFLLQYCAEYVKLSENRKTYVVANLVKSGILLCLTPFSIHFLYVLLLTFFNNDDIITSNDYKKSILISAIYCSTDMIALLVQKNMKKTTILHHIVVQKAFILLIVLGEYHPITNIILIYGSFSIFAYLVNFYLGFRHIIQNERFVGILVTLTHVIYIVSCLINWFIQIIHLFYFIYMAQFINSIILIGFNCVVINDDINLLRFLDKYSSLKNIQFD
tara:strand:+ start:2139 stop:2855 length:717 start_codon:yes stop_codon:yes gene_type:complete